MRPLRTERLILRNWEERDRELFHRINSDDRVMEFFPFRRNRAEADAKMDELRAAIDRDGFGFAAAEIAASGECIGFVGLSRTDHLPFLPAGSIEIDVYPGAHHSFDRVGGRVRERPEVRNPNRPGGRGATVGPHPEAREKAIARTTAWLEARGR